MAVFIHREARFNRRLDVPKRGDKKSSVAAEKAQEVIKKLFEGNLCSVTFCFPLKKGNQRTRPNGKHWDRNRITMIFSWNKLTIRSSGKSLQVFVANHERGLITLSMLVGSSRISTSGSRLIARAMANR